jgi:DNA-directed RNA polymerase specialized sigma24 family protein
METVQSKLADLFQKFYPFVFHRALFFLRRRVEAEDAASEVFLRMAKGLL